MNLMLVSAAISPHLCWFLGRNGKQKICLLFLSQLWRILFGTYTPYIVAEHIDQTCFGTVRILVAFSTSKSCNFSISLRCRKEYKTVFQIYTFLPQKKLFVSILVLMDVSQKQKKVFNGIQKSDPIGYLLFNGLESIHPISWMTPTSPETM